MGIWTRRRPSSITKSRQQSKSSRFRAKARLCNEHMDEAQAKFNHKKPPAEQKPLVQGESPVV